MAETDRKSVNLTTDIKLLEEAKKKFIADNPHLVSKMKRLNKKISFYKILEAALEHYSGCDQISVISEFSLKGNFTVPTKVAATLLSKSPRQIRNYIKEGKVDAAIIGGRWYIDETSLDKLIVNRRKYEE